MLRSGLRRFLLICLLFFTIYSNHTDQIQCMNGVVNDFIRFGILFYHNELRSNMTRGEYDFSPGTNMYRLRYSCELEKLAQERADDSCFNPNVSNYYLSGKVGENIYQNQHSSHTLENHMFTALKSWSTEKNATPHIAQMLSGATRLIGCATSKCSRAHEENSTQIIVCKYWPKVSKGPLYLQGSFCESGDDCTLHTNSTCNEITRLCDTMDNNDAEFNRFLRRMQENITESPEPEYTSTTPIGANFDISENLADIMDLSEADLEDGIAIASLNRNTKINDEHLYFKQLDVHRLSFLEAHRKRRSNILQGIMTFDDSLKQLEEFLFKLDWDFNLEKKAFEDAEKCELLEPKSSAKYYRMIMNEFNFENITHILDREFSMAVEEWWRNPAEMTLGNIGLFTATELGCGFASCVNENLQMTVDMVCHYWPINDPNQFYNYEISCETNDDCSSLPNSRCDFNQNICISKM